MERRAVRVVEDYRTRVGHQYGFFAVTFGRLVHDGTPYIWFGIGQRPSGAGRSCAITGERCHAWRKLVSWASCRKASSLSHSAGPGIRTAIEVRYQTNSRKSGNLEMEKACEGGGAQVAVSSASYTAFLLRACFLVSSGNGGVELHCTRSQ